jgi:ribosome-binding factor A
MRFYRADRVSKVIREELAKIIIREMEFDGALPTITTVDVDKKLEHATVNVSVIPSRAGDDVVNALTKNAGQLQHLLNRKMNIRPMPRIMFALDRGMENAAQVEKLLEEDDTIGE